MDIYSPLFPVREAMSHTAVFNWIASVVVRFLCDHADRVWTMDRHFDGLPKCPSGWCRCCRARTKRGYEPQGYDWACGLCSTAWRLSTVSRFWKDVTIAHGKALPRHTGWPAWSSELCRPSFAATHRRGLCLSQIGAISHKTVVSRRSSSTAHSEPLRRGTTGAMGSETSVGQPT